MPLVVSAARMRISLAFLRVLSAAVLFAGTTVLAQSQAPAPAKHWHTPRTLPRTKFYDTPNPLPAGKRGELIRSEPNDRECERQISGMADRTHQTARSESVRPVFRREADWAGDRTSSAGGFAAWGQALPGPG